MKISVAIVVFCIQVFAQGEIMVGDDAVVVGIPLDTKMIDVGFRNASFVNVVTVNRTNHMMLRWHQAKFDSTVGFSVILGVPRCKITEKEFGLVRVDSLGERAGCRNFISPREVGGEKSLLVSVAGFDYLAQIVARNRRKEIVAVSQIRYIKQRWK